MAALFADVLLPLPLFDKFTYRIPDSLQEEVKPGKRVAVQFGNQKHYAGIVLAVHHDFPTGYRLKDIISVIDENPVLFEGQLTFWRWIAGYYCCPLGDVMKAALPSALKLESHSEFRIAQAGSDVQLNEDEKIILDFIKEKNRSLNEIQKYSGKSSSFRIVKKLTEIGFIEICEEMQTGFKPKLAEFVALSPEAGTPENSDRLKSLLQRSAKQRGLFDHFLNKTNYPEANLSPALLKKELLAGTGYNHTDLNGLVRKGILKVTTKVVSRIEDETVQQTSLTMLSHDQQEALEKIRTLFRSKPAVLLYGVTASGKTEIYIHLIDEVIRNGRQVLYLVPEIVLTTQIIRRLKNVFGPKVGVYHSKLNDQERVEIWNKVLLSGEKKEESCQIILGARSAIFLPFSNLGLVVVDEEHEASYKQNDPAPRYHARDLSVLLASLSKAPVLLGSATPSSETYFNVITGKFGFAEMTKRYSDVKLPGIETADLLKAYRKKQMTSVFTPLLFQKMKESLDASEQIILFQNRRGYAVFIECMNCGWIPKCKSCDVSLTYHKLKNRLTCHYCGNSDLFPEKCPLCSSNEVKTRGFGTEKIENELKRLFRNAVVARMDTDSTHSRSAYDQLIRNLEAKKTDILVGTQMVTKGLDLGNVNLVGILNADNLLNFPDFRAHERAFQLLSQVSGRAGRRKKEGIVVIQTSQPDHPVIQAVKTHTFEQFIKNQLEERKLFNYPPYSRLLKITVKHKNQEKGERIANQLAALLRNETRFTLLGPESPLITRIQTWHLREMWIKLPKSSAIPEMKKFIIDSIETIKRLPDNSGTMINIDVDPI